MSRPGRIRAQGPLMALPALAGLLVFVGVPFLYSIALSFYEVRLGSPEAPSFTGLEHYRRLFSHPDISPPFRRALLNNLTFAVVVVPLQTGLALALAVLLNRRLRGMGVLRALFFLPVVLPMALVAVLWRPFLSRGEDGIINAALSHLTPGSWEAHDWLGSATTAMASVIVLSVWQGVGFQMLIFLAGLHQIPDERYEAAMVDRAGPWQRFRHVTLPGLRTTVVFVALLTSVLAFRVFDQVYILIRGGGLNEEATHTVMYQAVTTAFDQNNTGMASAITVVFFLIVLALTLLQRGLVRTREEKS